MSVIKKVADIGVRVRLLIGRGVANVVGEPLDLSWVEVIELIHEHSKPQTREDDQRKKSGLWLSFAEYKGNHRKRENLFGLIWAVVLDLDLVRDPEQVKAALQRWTYVAYTTWSSTPGALRWRIIIPIAGGIAPADYATLVDRIAAPIANAAKLDGRSRYPEQLWFSTAHKRSQANHHKIWTNSGRPIRANLLLVNFPQTVIPDGSRDNELTSAAGRMRRRGASREQIEAGLRTANERCDPPKTEKDVRRISKSVSRYPVGGAVEKEQALAFRKESQAIGEGPAESDPHPGLYTIVEMVKEAVFISDGSQVALRDDPRLVWSFADFVNMTRASEVGSGPKGGRPTGAAKLWLKHPQRITVHTRTFRAGGRLFCQSPDDVLAINTWREPPRIAPPSDWRERARPFFDHVEYLVPIPEEREFFLNWLAHIEQQAGVLPHVHVLMFTTRQGIGRNWLASVCARAWAGVTALDVDLPSLLEGGFNGRLSRKVLAVVNEIHGGGGNYRHADRLKGLLTDERRRINPKFGREYDEFNAVRWLMFSNHENALPLDRFDRRVYAIQNPVRPRSVGYYAKIYRMASDAQFIASVREALRTRDIRRFNPGMHAPLTETKQRVIEAAMPEADRLMLELVRDHPSDCITAERLCRSLWGIRTTAKEMGALPYIAARAGAQRYPEQIRLGPKRVRYRVWILRNQGKWLAASSHDVGWEVQRGEGAASHA